MEARWGRTPLFVVAIAVSVLSALVRSQAQPPAPPPTPSPYAELVQRYLWPSSPADHDAAAARLKQDASLTGLNRQAFHDLEEEIRRGPLRLPDPAPAAAGEGIRHEWTVAVPHGPPIPVLVQVPPRYSPDTEWPLMYAMHGGPPSQDAQTRAGAERMLRVWSQAAARAGWIVAAPGLTPSITAGGRTDDRLPYEIVHPEQARAVVAALRERYRINPDRIVSTGISLGSNYSIAYAAGEPGWLSAIVPVSTEGDSRELLLRNLRGTPVYVLEGTRDRNIRMIDGPRAMAEILTGLGEDVTYREFGDRAHEGFQEHYDDVLRWLDARPRQVYPRQVVRVPHPAIVPVSRRVHWIESDTRQGLIRAQVLPPDRIEIAARWTRRLTLYLHDRLVDLDRPLTVTVNGVPAFTGVVRRSAGTALEEVRRLGDERRIYAARLVVDVPAAAHATPAAERFAREMNPVRPVGTLSFWEMFATRSLDERFPDLGLTATDVPLPSGTSGWPDQVALRVDAVRPDGPLARAGLQPGDQLIAFDGEPFVRGRGVSHLRAWLLRELRRDTRPFSLDVRRGGQPLSLSVPLALGPYATPPSAQEP